MPAPTTPEMTRYEKIHPDLLHLLAPLRVRNWPMSAGPTTTPCPNGTDTLTAKPKEDECPT